MLLFVFAHRGEAQTFISKLKLKSIDDRGNLYGNSEILLLLAGEGIYSVMVRLPYVLGKYEVKGL